MSGSAVVGSAVARDGTVLRTRRWAPVEAPWARVVLVHGTAEHSGRYERTGSLLAAAGVDVTAFDLRGFGESGGPRAYVGGWAVYLDDVEDRLAASRDGLPLVLMGHSMGGLVALTYLLDGRATPDLCVLSSPAIGTTVPLPVRAAAPVLGRLTPMLRLSNGLRGDQLSSDPEVARAYFADRLVTPRSTARLGAELFGAAARARRELRALPVPTLVTHGSDDTIVPPSSTEPLGALPNVVRRVYPGLRHETLNEPQGPQVVADIVAWLRANAAPAS